MSMLEHALTWWNLGYAPLPIRPNGTKAPACRWRDFLETRPTKDELGILFAVDHDGYGIITGGVSGNLEMLELEGRAMTRNATENAKTGPRTREQPDPAYKDAEVSACRAESHTEPAGATEILRLIAHGRCECDLCTSRQRAKTEQLAVSTQCRKDR